MGAREKIGSVLDLHSCYGVYNGFVLTKTGSLLGAIELSGRTQGETAEAPVVFHLPGSARVLAHHGRLKVAAWPGAARTISVTPRGPRVG